jgi:hypothetical protein
MMGAQTQPVPDVLITWLIGTPVTVLAFLVAAFIQGWVVPGRLHNRRLAELDALAEQMRQRDRVWEEKILPVLTHANLELARIARREANG